MPAGSKQDPQGGIFKTNPETTAATSDDNIQTQEEKETLVCTIPNKQVDDKSSICGSGHVIKSRRFTVKGGECDRDVTNATAQAESTQPSPLALMWCGGASKNKPEEQIIS